MTHLLPTHDPETVRRYCKTPGCETTWRRVDQCPVCGGEGEPGSTGNEPRGWPVLSAADIPMLPGEKP